MADLYQRIFIDAVDNASSVVKGFTSSILDGVASFGRWTALAGQAKDAVVGVLSGLAQAADNTQQWTIQLTSLTGSTAAATDILTKLSAWSKTTPFDTASIEKVSEKMLAMGYTSAEVVPTLEAVGSAVYATGGGVGQVESIIRSMERMRETGTVSIGNISMLTRQGIAAWDILAQELGVTVPQAMDMVKTHAISADEVVQMLTDGMTKRYGPALAQFATSYEGQLKNLESTWTGLMKAFATPILPAVTLIFQQMALALQDPIFKQFMLDVGALVSGALTGLLGMMQQVVPWFSTLFSTMTGGQTVLQLITTLVGLISTAFAQIAPFLAPIASDFQVLSSVFGEIVSSMVQQFFQTLMVVIQSIAPLIGPVADALTQLGLALMQVAAVSIFQVFQMLQQVMLALAPLLPPLVQAFAQLGQVLIQVASSVIAQVLQSIQQVMLALAPTLPPLVQAFLQLAGALLQIAGSVIVSVFQTLTPLLVTVLPVVVQIATALLNMATTILTFLGPATPVILAVVAAMWALYQVTAVNTVGTLANLVSLIPTVVGLFGLWVAKLWEQVAVQGALNVAAAWGWLTNLISLIPTAIGLFGIWIADLWAGVAAWVAHNAVATWGWLTMFISAIPTAIGLFGIWIADIWGAVAGFVALKATQIADFFANITTTLPSLISSISGLGAAGVATAVTLGAATAGIGLIAYGISVQMKDVTQQMEDLHQSVVQSMQGMNMGSQEAVDTMTGQIIYKIQAFSGKSYTDAAAIADTWISEAQRGAQGTVDSTDTLATAEQGVGDAAQTAAEQLKEYNRQLALTNQLNDDAARNKRRILDPEGYQQDLLDIANLKSHLDDLDQPRAISIGTQNVTAAQLKVIDLKSHLDDLDAAPYVPSIGTQNVTVAQQKVIDLKSHLDDLDAAPYVPSIGTQNVTAAQLKVIDLKSHLDDLTVPVVPSIGLIHINDAILQVANLKAHLDDLANPVVPSIGLIHINDAILRVAQLKTDIDNIPNKDVYITTYFTNIGGGVGGAQHGVSNFRGGPLWVGEGGPELLFLPRGSSVLDHADSSSYTRGTYRSDGSRSGMPAVAAPISVGEIHLHLHPQQMTEAEMNRAVTYLGDRLRAQFGTM